MTKATVRSLTWTLQCPDFNMCDSLKTCMDLNSTNWQAQKQQPKWSMCSDKAFIVCIFLLTHLFHCTRMTNGGQLTEFGRRHIPL